MELWELLRNAGRVVICGMGNEMRGDDAFGLLVVEKLRELVKSRDILILNCGEVPESYTGKIASFKPDLVVFVDAVEFGGRHGDMIVADPEDTIGEAISTHGLPLRFLVQYLKERTGARFILIGCQPRFLGLFEEPSDVIRERAEQLARALAGALGGRSDD
ncbi:hydrogenase 3 maturation endopeptidase HyCI [Pyrococcus yayanosii]|uniref:Hydrogenase maturation protease HycI n=1 Tax=Pyrococcus yayanosii (strain CH1 / JCM 16557) TaxID=529709 RepID=F8AIU3_PYRYC|nr:hydrogenase 3 maturation endopeptidase HyCI [Pyrococcus yayanosii]AEH24332.1 hydrogenase maturation protease HycI [Pyrococcus yayanosii CH1]